jgi:hypothetical protein
MMELVVMAIGLFLLYSGIAMVILAHKKAYKRIKKYLEEN